MRLYRYLTGVDDQQFCHRVSAALNRGWLLHGPPTLTYDAKAERVICGQAIIKEVKGREYSPDIDLSAY